MTEKIRDVELRWLGQAGYELRLGDRMTCWIDAYLSDEVEELLGPIRIATPPTDVLTKQVDLVITTHWHADHLDTPTCLRIADVHRDAMFVGPSSCVARLAGRGVSTHRLVALNRGGVFKTGPITVHATFARHSVPGWLTEDAIGLAIKIGDVRIFHSGDTEYDTRCLDARAYGPYDVGIFVGNGSGGNMSMREAALMAHEIAPLTAIPAHYGMWSDPDYGSEATLDPTEFVDYCGRLGGPPARILEHGETMVVSSSSS